MHGAVEGFTPSRGGVHQHFENSISNFQASGHAGIGRKLTRQPPLDGGRATGSGNYPANEHGCHRFQLFGNPEHMPVTSVHFRMPLGDGGAFSPSC